MTEAQSKDDVIDLVETFIRRCHDLDYVFNPESIKLVVHDTDFSKRVPWANVIGDAMSQYLLDKRDPAKRLVSAQECLNYINKAFAAGIVKEGPGLIKKHKEAEAKIVELNTKVEGLSKENLFLQAKIELMEQGRKF